MNKMTLSVKELGDGKYSVSFTPVQYGDHVINIQINGINISNSPVKIVIMVIPEKDNDDDDDDDCGIGLFD